MQLKWLGGWLIGTPGEEEGHVRLACRPATVARWVYDNLHETEPAAAYCAAGNSGGAAQISYMLTHYGLEEVLDLIIPNGGPPMGRLDRACIPGDTASNPLWYPSGWPTRIIDAGFGFPA